MASGSVRADEVVEIAPGAVIEYTVEGPVSTFASISDFTVRGERIDASQAVISGGSLAQGRRVRVKGVAGPGKLTATEVVIL
jgi:cold shock CspA family protein